MSILQYRIYRSIELNNQMTLEQLRIFVEVAERQHLTQAAAVLALTPSAVSASIKVLEERYGTALFNRVGRGIEQLVELSASGKLKLEESITHTFPLEEVNTALKYLHEKIENPIRVAVTL